MSNAEKKNVEQQQRQQITPKKFRLLSSEEQKEIAQAIKDGKIDIVPSGEQSSGEQVGIIGAFQGDGLSTCLPDNRSLLEDDDLKGTIFENLHPTVIAARIEALKTAVETKSARMIAIGNIQQAEFLNKFLSTINSNPQLLKLLIAQAKEYLPEGADDIFSLSPSLQLNIFIRALGDLTTMPEKIEAYERARGRHNKEIAEIHAMIAFAKELYGSVAQLPTATQQLSQINRQLVPYIEEQKRFLKLRSVAERDRLATNKIIFLSQVSGVTGGLVGGVVGGLAAVPTYAGDELQKVAERAPIPTSGGVLGLLLYAYINKLTLTPQHLTPEHFSGALLSFTIGALGLPLVVGIIQGFAKSKIK